MNEMKNNNTPDYRCLSWYLVDFSLLSDSFVAHRENTVN